MCRINKLKLLFEYSLFSTMILVQTTVLSFFRVGKLTTITINMKG